MWLSLAANSRWDCAFDYRWRPVARDEGDPPFSWSLGKGFYSYTNFLWGPEVATDASRSKSYTGGGFICRDGVYDFWR